MKGTIFDFLKLATEKPDLAEELVALAAKYGFEFSDEVSDDELENVAGGVINPEVVLGTADSFVSGTSASRASFKSTLDLLAEAVEQRDDAITKMTNT